MFSLTPLFRENVAAPSAEECSVRVFPAGNVAFHPSAEVALLQAGVARQRPPPHLARAFRQR